MEFTIDFVAEALDAGAGKSRRSPCRGRLNPPAILAVPCPARRACQLARNFILTAGFQPAAGLAQRRRPLAPPPRCLMFLQHLRAPADI